MIIDDDGGAYAEGGVHADAKFVRSTSLDHLISPLPERLREVMAKAMQQLFSQGTTDAPLFDKETEQ